LFFSCQSQDNSGIEETLIEEDPTEDTVSNKELQTTMITILQTFEGVQEERNVIIQTPSTVNTTKNYPIVFAFHGNGGSNNSWVNKLKPITNTGGFIGIYFQVFFKIPVFCIRTIKAIESYSYFLWALPFAIQYTAGLCKLYILFVLFVCDVKFYF